MQFNNAKKLFRDIILSIIMKKNLLLKPRKPTVPLYGQNN